MTAPPFTSAGWEVTSLRPEPGILRELWDRRRIEDALLRYCRGIDRCDADLIRSAYHDDATDDHGVFRGTAAEFAAWAVAGLASVPQSTTHVLTNVLVEVAGDDARSECRFVGTHVEDGADGVRLTQFHGRYLDVFAYRGGRWAIADRRTVYDWSESRRGRRAMDPADPRFTHGRRGPGDPVFDWPALRDGGRP